MPAGIVVGVGAGIAAYKAAEVVRALERRGHDVWVVPTPASLHFVGASTWRELAGHPVHTGVFEGAPDHVELARRARAIVVVAATADLIARVRAGMADDLLTATILAFRGPVMLVPAMHTAMWQNPATRDNVAELRRRGVEVVEPASGPLSSGDRGPGRLPDPADVAARVGALIDAGTPARDLAGVRVLVTAGGTREPLDPVRYLGNRSSGRQGCALAREALRRGARVTLLAASVAPELVPAGAAVVPAPSAADLDRAVRERLDDTDVLLMAAAVADFRPRAAAEQKIAKDPDDPTGVPTIELERTPDILATVARGPRRPAVLVGFAAETGDAARVLERGRRKARRKGADLLAVNAVGAGRGFGDVDNDVRLLDAEGREVARVQGPKERVAARILDEVASLAADRIER